MARDGDRLLDELLGHVEHARARLRKLPGVVLPCDVIDPSVGLDRAKLPIQIAGTGATGLAIEDALVAAGLPVEFADRDTVVPIVSIADDRERVDRFVDAFTAIVERQRRDPRGVRPSIAWSVEPRVVVSPRDAFFAPHATLPTQEAIGRVSAELVAPYPPGIPVLAPGELVTAEAIEGLREAMSHGTQVRYAADPSLRTLQVVDG